MKIAFIRGPHLNHYELQCYAPLVRQHDFYAIGADWQLRPNDLTERVPIRKAHAWGATFASVSTNLAITANRALSWTWGRSYGLYDFNAIVGQPDLLHSAEVFSTQSYQSLQLKRTRRCGLVVTVWENIRGMGETHPLRRARKRQVIAEADAFLAVTETTRAMLMQEGVAENKIEVIPMGVNQSRFRPAPKDPALMQQFHLDPTDVIVLFMGRFVPEKGIQPLLNAIPATLAKVRSPRIRFLFAGAGPLLPALQKAQQRLGDAIVLSPFVPYEQVPSMHNLADIFVLPSQIRHKVQEQWGHVLTESMSCGKPVISTRVGSIPDVIGDAGILVAPEDTAALQAALLKLLDPKERADFAQRALRRAQQEFDRDRNAVKIQQLYERVYSHL